MTITHVFVPLTKAEKKADGTMLVSGPATSSALDRDAQVCDPSWLDTAMPQWFGEGGNVREMHTSIAAGKALTYWKADDGKHWIEALVVDPGSVAKVEHEVLTGFSIGIKGARVIKSESAPNGAIVGGSIIEVSLVDRPANPECLLTVAKSDDAGLVAPVEVQALVEGVEAVAEVSPEVGEPEVIVLDSTPAEQAAPMKEAAAEVRERAGEVMAALNALFPGERAPWAAEKAEQGDEGKDIADAQAAVAIIARLIQSEASSLAEGDLSEACDIDLLLSAVSALRWFIEREEAETGKADVPDTPDEATSEVPAPEGAIIEETKSDDVEPDGAPVVKAEAPDGVDLDKAETLLLGKVEAMVTEALAEVTKSHEAALEALRDELAKVKSQPVPGGPVRVRTSIEKSQAVDHDRATLLAEAARYDAQADEVSDRALADGYRALAAQKRAQASA